MIIAEASSRLAAWSARHAGRSPSCSRDGGRGPVRRPAGRARRLSGGQPERALLDAGGTAGGSDYTSDGLLELAAGESRGVIKIAILDDDEIEDDEEFFVDLADPAVSGLKAADAVAAHAGGPKLFASCTVVIKDDDVQPGTLRWQKESVRCCESDRSSRSSSNDARATTAR